MNHTMNAFAPHPWYVASNDITTTLRDRDGRIIANLVPDNDMQREHATGRLLTYAPTLLISLRFAVGILRRAGDHEDLCKHLQAMIDLVEPEGKLERAAKKATRAVA